MSWVFDFDYKPADGEFTVLVGGWDTHTYHRSEHEDLASALRAFGKHALPMRINRVAWLTDSTTVDVMHYACEGVQAEAVWWGCRTAFEQAAELGIADPVSLAIYEERARTYMQGQATP